MRQFVGSHTKEFDAKGRVMIPHAYRNSLRLEDGTIALTLRPSPRHTCIEGWPTEVLNGLIPKVADIDPFDEEAEIKALTLFAQSETPAVDKEGRLILPERMMKRAGITNAVMFIGLGNRFQIWEPAAGERRLEAAGLAVAAMGPKA